MEDQPERIADLLGDLLEEAGVFYEVRGGRWTDEAKAFIQTAYDSGWVLPDFDWGKWKSTQEAIDLYNNPRLLAQATAIRQDRFVEGGLLRNFKSGHILAIVRRAAVLLDELLQ